MNKPDNVLGTVPLPILKELERRYPEVVPSPKDSVESIMFRSGARSVVKWLTETFDPRGYRHGA